MKIVKIVDNVFMKAISTTKYNFREAIVCQGRSCTKCVWSAVCISCKMRVRKKFKLMKIVLLKDSVIIPRMLRRSDHDKMFNEYATCFISSRICAKFCAYRNVCGTSKSYRGEFSKNHWL